MSDGDSGAGKGLALTDLCIRRPVVAWMLMFAVMMFGGHALWKIGVSQLPDVDFPVVNVTFTWQGASPEVIEKDVIEVVQDALGQVQGVEDVSATARQGVAFITLNLQVGREVNNAVQEVQTRIAQVQRLLPKDLDPPVIEKFNPEEQPFMWITLAGEASRQRLADVMRDQVTERLRRVPGVGGIENGSALVRNVRIWIDPDKALAAGLTVPEVVAALPRQHLELPAGRLDNGLREVNVRVLGEASSLPDFGALVVGGDATRPVRLRQIAAIEDGFADVRSFFRNNGRDAEAIGVRKQYGQNTVAVADLVKAEFASIQASLPMGMTLAVNYDATVFIKKSVKDVEQELMLAVILTALTCLFFLGSWSASFNVILAIPMSILGTIAVIHACGWTLNTFTLLALALVVGIVVDDAIMVQENIARHRAMGMAARDAAREGTRQIAFAALASTLAVIVIFLPLAFMQGVIGKFFIQFGVTMCVAVAFSYLEAITLAPARCAQFMAAAGNQTSAFARFAESLFERLAHWYAGLLAVSLRRPWLVLLAAVIAFVAAIVGFGRALPFELSPSQDQSALLLRIETSPQASISETDRISHQAEVWLSARPEVDHVFAIVGGFGGTGINTVVMFVSLTDPKSRVLSQNALAEEARTVLTKIPGCAVTIEDLSKGGLSSGRGFPVEFSLRGPEWPALTTAVRSMMDTMRSTEVRELGKAGTKAPRDIFRDVDTSLQTAKPELAVVPDRERIQDLGLNVDQVAQAISAMLSGVKIGKYTDGIRRLDVRAGVMYDARITPEDVARLRLRVPGGQTVPLSAVAHIQERGVLDAITRRNGSRSIAIYADTVQGVGTDTALEAIKALAKDLPTGVEMVEQGLSKEQQRTFQDFGIVWLMGLVLAYMVLACQFNSLIHPVTVLSVMPLAVAGALASLWLGNFSLNIFSIIGVLLLMGIVKKNSIILVDYANQERERGLDKRAAIIAAGTVRLRPILMTSVATMAAALPIAIGFGAGAEVRQPMAVSILGGVVVTTLISLFTVPALYVLFGGKAQREHDGEPA